MRIFGVLIRENNFWSYESILSDEKSISDRKSQEVFWYYLRTTRLPYHISTQMTIQVSTTMAIQQKTEKYSMRMSIDIFQNASEIFHIPIWYWPEIGPRSVTVRRKTGNQFHISPTKYLQVCVHILRAKINRCPHFLRSTSLRVMSIKAYAIINSQHVV